MARRRRLSDFSLTDIPLVFSNLVLATVVACCGLAEVILYYALEPTIGDSASPMTFLPHIFWEAVAVRFFWPGVAMLGLGLLGIAVCCVRNALKTEQF